MADIKQAFDQLENGEIWIKDFAQIKDQKGEQTMANEKAKVKEKAKKAPPVLTVDGNEFRFEDLNAEQKVMYQHLADLQRKSNTTRFNLDQLKVGQEAFGRMLVDSLSKGDEGEVAEGPPKKGDT